MAIHENLKVQKLKLGEQEYEICDANALHEHQEIKQDGFTGATINRFGICSAEASTAAKTVSITTGTFTLEAGAKVTIKFANSNTASSPTLQVNTSDAKPIYHKGVQITDGANKALLAGVVDFVYDGDYWHLIGNYVGTVKYLGTVSSIEGLSTAAGQGDFYRALVEFSLSDAPGSEIAHIGDILIATKDNPTAVTDWDLIHTEVDSNTWVANTVDAAGFVEAPTAQNPNKVWKTDANGNPGWREEDIIYSSNKTGGARFEVGGLPKNFNLNGLSVKQILDKIFFPYTNIEVGEPTVKVKNTAGNVVGVASNYTYVIPNYPTLHTVILPVTQNDARSLAFDLYDVTNGANTKLTTVSITESDIQSNELTFSRFTPSQVYIDTTREFEIRYTYLNESNQRIPGSTIKIGPFKLTFSNPTIDNVTPYYNEAAVSRLNYAVGEPLELDTIIATTTLNSAKIAGSIQNVTLTKKTQVGTNASTTDTSFSSTVTNSVDNNTGIRTDTFAVTENLDPRETTTYTYTTTVSYKKRGSDSTNLTGSAVSTTKDLQIKFTYSNPTVTLTLAGISKRTNISKLNPVDLSNKTLTATYAKNSGEITSVALYYDSDQHGSGQYGNVVAVTPRQNSDTKYKPTTATTTFTYNDTKVCSDLTLSAKISDGSNTVTSNEISLSFYAPCLYGFIPKTENFASITAEKLKTYVNKLTGSSSTATKTDFQSSPIDSTSPGNEKFLYAIPIIGNFTGFTSAMTQMGQDFGSFDTAPDGSTFKEIEFEDGSKVTYQILITSGPYNKIAHKFS